MHKKLLFLVFCLGLINFSYATNSINNHFNTSDRTQSVLQCNIPAPSKFHVTEVGLQSVSLDWDMQSDAIGGYRIRTYRTSDDALISTVIRSQDQSDVTITGLSNGTEYYFVLNSRCEDGGNSEKQVNIGAGTLIVELVVIGYQGPVGTPVICTINAMNEQCNFGNSTISHFKVQRGLYVRTFGIQVDESGDNPKMTIMVDNQYNSPIKFFCDDVTVPSPPTNSCWPFQYISIKFNGILLGQFEFEVGSGTSTSSITCSSYNTGEIFMVEPIEEEFGGPGKGGSAPTGKGFIEHQMDFASTSKNPFSETLDVLIERSDIQSIQLQLFNLSGQKVLDQQLAGGQEQYSLSTEGLSNGFYFLRIEADGQVQTLKVIKSE